MKNGRIAGMIVGMALLWGSASETLRAQITFGTPGTFTTDGVLISGPLLYAVNPGALTTTTNVGPQGITFQSDASNTNPNVTFVPTSGSFGNGLGYISGTATSGDAAFDTVLNAGGYNTVPAFGPNGAGAAITLNNLTSGRSYQVELIAVDTRGIYTGGTFTVNNVAGPATAAQQYAYTNGSPALGGYITGNFTATSNSITFDTNTAIVGGIFSEFQVNALVVTVTDFNLEMTPGLTANQLAVAQNLDGDNPVSGPIGAIIAAIGNGPASQIGAELDQLSPQNLQIFRHIAFDNFSFTATELDDHTASLRYGEGGFDASGFQVLNSSLPPMMGQIEGHLLAWAPPSASHGLLSDTTGPVFGGSTDPKDAKEMQGVTAVTDKNRWSSFISGNVILADSDADPNVANQHYTTGSVTAGADYRLDDHWAVGALAGYGHTDAEFDSNGSGAHVDSYSPGVYATYADHGWFANGLFTYDYNSYHESRAITFLGQTATGSPDGNQFNGDLDGGYEFHRGDLTFGPIAGLQYVHLDVNSFTESGAGAADLAVNDQQDDSLRSRLGGQFRYNWSWYGGKVIATPHLSAAWQHEYLDNSTGITSQFAGAGLGSFLVNTTKQDRDTAFIDAGLDTQWNDALSLFVDYQTEAGASDFYAQSFLGGVKVSF